MDRAEIIRLFKEERELQRKLAKRRSSAFATFLNKKMDIQWFQKIVYDNLDSWIKGDIKKLAIFMPPQHGKSTMSSIYTPAKILGKNPSAKIAVVSYSEKLASKFNRACQDIIDSDEYKELYPGVVLPTKGIESTNELRNNTYFETIKHKGSFKAVSIGGSLTGDPVDFGIIDDPIKDRKQANSKTYRDNIWDFYQEVFLQRLHNDSSQLLLFTRWHEDDLAGRLFNPKNEFYDEEEAKEWTVLCFQALKEQELPMPIAVKYDDPRDIGDALWEQKHSKIKHEKFKRINPSAFASLDQQRPAPTEGNKIKREWFQIIKESELPFNPRMTKRDFIIDGAFTKEAENDESAQMACSFYKGDLYIFNCHGVRKELFEYLEFINPWLKSMGYKSTSEVCIEMKASGYGFYSMLRKPQYGKFNCTKINNKHVKMGKMERVENSQATLASGKVFLVQGSWNKPFIDQCASFPNDTHDDMVDCLTYAIHKYFIGDENVGVVYS
jgi:predicted phage terminase large subunit-like protein